MKDRFSLEDDINHLYSFSQQLENLSEGILEYDLSKDDICNAVEGLKVMIELHAQKMESTMVEIFNLNTVPKWHNIYDTPQP